jgi:hypothetical protein
MLGLDAVQKECEIYKNELFAFREALSSKEDSDDDLALIEQELYCLARNLELQKTLSIVIQWREDYLENMKNSLVIRRAYKFFLKMLTLATSVFQHVTFRGDGISFEEIIQYVKDNLTIKTVIIEKNGSISTLLEINDFYTGLNSALNLYAVEFRQATHDIWTAKNYPHKIAKKLLQLAPEKNILIDFTFILRTDRRLWTKIDCQDVSKIQMYDAAQPLEAIDSYPISEKRRVTFIKTSASIELHYDLHEAQSEVNAPFDELERAMQREISSVQSRLHLCSQRDLNSKTKVFVEAELKCANYYETRLHEAIANSAEKHFARVNSKLDIIEKRGNLDELVNEIVETNDSVDGFRFGHGVSLILKDLFSSLLISDEIEGRFRRIIALLESPQNLRELCVYPKAIALLFQKKEKIKQIISENIDGLIMIIESDIEYHFQLFFSRQAFRRNKAATSEGLSKNVYDYRRAKDHVIFSEGDKDLFGADSAIAIDTFKIDSCLRPGFVSILSELEFVEDQRIGKNQWRLIDYAAYHGNILATQLLSFKKIDFISTDSEKKTVIDIASRYSDRSDVLRILLDVSLPLPDGNIFLSEDAYRAVVEKRSNAGDEHNSLSLACAGKKTENIKFLVKCNVEINELLGEKRAIDIAFDQEDYINVALLLKNGSYFPRNFKEETIPENSIIHQVLKERIEIQSVLESGDKKAVLRKCEDGVLTPHYISLNDRSAPYIAFSSGKYEAYALLRAKGFSVLKEEENNISISIKTAERATKLAVKNAILAAVNSQHFSTINFLLSRTKILQPDQGRFDYIRECYNELAEINEIFIVMRVLEHADLHVSIVFDFDRDHTQDISPTDGTDTRGSCDYSIGHISIGAKADRRELLGTLAHELTHQAMQIVYKNRCNPYTKEDNESREAIENINYKIGQLAQYDVLLLEEEYIFRPLAEDPDSFEEEGMFPSSLGEAFESLKEEDILPSLEDGSKNLKKEENLEMIKIYISEKGNYIVHSRSLPEILEGELPKEDLSYVRNLSKRLRKEDNRDFKKSILNMIQKKENIVLITVDEIIQRVYGYEPIDRVAELIVRVNHMLAKYNQEDGQWLLSRQAPELYAFYQKCLPHCEKYIEQQKTKGLPVIVASDQWLEEEERDAVSKLPYSSDRLEVERGEEEALPNLTQANSFFAQASSVNHESESSLLSSSSISQPISQSSGSSSQSSAPSSSSSPSAIPQASGNPYIAFPPPPSPSQDDIERSSESSANLPSQRTG